MNCDLAFDLMTDVHGCHSQALHYHLKACPRCREMQATLAPALDWLQDHDANEPHSEEPTALGAAGGAPRSRSVVTSEALQVALTSAAALGDRATPRAKRLRNWAATGLRYAAILVAGGCLGLALAPAPPSKNATSCRRLEAAADRQSRPAAETQSLIASCARCHDARPIVPTTERLGSFLAPLPFQWLADWAVAQSSWSADAERLLGAESTAVNGVAPASGHSARRADLLA